MMLRRYPAFLGLGYLLGLAACSGSEPPAATRASGDEVAVTSSPPPQPAPEPDLTAHMQASFWMAVRARDALIAGDLAAAQRAGDALATQDYARQLPADWLHWVDQLKRQARDLSIAPSLASASQELGRIALTCGECHDLHQRGPQRVRPEPEPWRDPPEDFDQRMNRHQIGAAQIWDGLIMPSEAAFRAGTMTLTRAPLEPPLRAGEPIDSSWNARVEEVRVLAREARTAGTYAERGRIYGELIARCANCHAYLRRGSF